MVPNIIALSYCITRMTTVDYALHRQFFLFKRTSLTPLRVSGSNTAPCGPSRLRRKTRFLQQRDDVHIDVERRIFLSSPSMLLSASIPISAAQR
jgi:hypothetical protein